MTLRIPFRGFAWDPGRSGDEDCDVEVVVVDTVDIEIVEGGGGGLEIDRDCLSEYSSNLGVISDCPRSTTGRLKSISSFVSSSVCDISCG